MNRMIHTAFFAFFAFLCFNLASVSAAEVFVVGAEKCQKCHKAEHSVWEGTAHFKSFKTVHKNKKAKAIVKAIGEKRMKKAAVCKACHYSEVTKKPGAKPKLISGPSCESCHGPASNWIDVHNDYGGSGAKRETETPEHKIERIAKARAAGMIWPSQTFDVASNCMSCHGLANPALSGEHAAAMLDNGHPINSEFELVAYSQGSVRHRFYSPDFTSNKEMTEIEKARVYVIGQAAALLSATEAMQKTEHAKYKDAQNRRVSKATGVLETITGSVPQAAAFLAGPSQKTGQALADALADADLTTVIGSHLPAVYK